MEVIVFRSKACLVEHARKRTPTFNQTMEPTDEIFPIKGSAQDDECRLKIHQLTRIHLTKQLRQIIQTGASLAVCVLTP